MRPEGSGGNRDWREDPRVDQAYASVRYLREGRGGRHELTAGVQLLRWTVAERWVHDGNVITAAGVSAGIDMALYLVGQLKGEVAARNLQKGIEYDPAPPYQQVSTPMSS